MQNEEPTFYDPNGDTNFDDRLGECYRIAADAFLDHRNENLPEARLVHGTIQNCQDDRYAIGHAWVTYTYQLNDMFSVAMVFEPTTGEVMPEDAARVLFGIKPRISYTREEARRKILETKHWGNWDGYEEHPAAVERCASAEFEKFSK